MYPIAIRSTSMYGRIEQTCSSITWNRRYAPFFLAWLRFSNNLLLYSSVGSPDSKVRGGNMGPVWGREDPDGPHVGPMNFAIWGIYISFEECVMHHGEQGPKGSQWIYGLQRTTHFNQAAIFIILNRRPWYHTQSSTTERSSGCQFYRWVQVLACWYYSLWKSGVISCCPCPDWRVRGSSLSLWMPS